MDPAVAAALRVAHDSDDYWEPVLEQQARGDRATFELACTLVRSDDTRSRGLGLDVLGQLGFNEGRPFLEESLPLVVSVAGGSDDDTDADLAVMMAAISALGHLADERGLDAVVRHRDHPDSHVRFAVAVALGWVAGDPPSDVAVDALVELTTDDDADVRDWATFALGTLLDVDTPAVRDALVARLDDPDPDTEGEAMVGLANRGDTRALENVRAALEAGDCGTLVTDAAAAFGSRDLLPALLRLKAQPWDPGDVRAESLDAAIEACTRPVNSPR